MQSKYNKIWTWVGYVVLIVLVIIVLWGIYDKYTGYQSGVKKDKNDTIKKAINEKTLNKEQSPMGDWIQQVLK